jgi:hypothetical protein
MLLLLPLITLILAEILETIFLNLRFLRILRDFKLDYRHVDLRRDFRNNIADFRRGLSTDKWNSN